jgi:hypothetical protein
VQGDAGQPGQQGGKTVPSTPPPPPHPHPKKNEAEEKKSHLSGCHSNHEVPLGWFETITKVGIALHAAGPLEKAFHLSQASQQPVNGLVDSTRARGLSGSQVAEHLFEDPSNPPWFREPGFHGRVRVEEEDAGHEAAVGRRIGVQATDDGAQALESI